MEKRENAYDLLRIASAIAVIMIHVSDNWFTDAIKKISDKGLCITDIQSPIAICIYHSITRFAVPCFIMCSGAFILDDERNADYKMFYSKSFSKIGIPTIIFSALYILYRIPLCFAGEKSDFFILAEDIFKGSPMYHMWYLYMLVGIYAMVPIILRFKKSIPEKIFYRISFVFLILASVSKWTTKTVRLSWDVGQAFEYLGYFMIGYSIRKMCKIKNNVKGCILILSGLLFEICAAGLEYKQIIDGVSGVELKYQIISPSSPLIVIASILIWGGGVTALHINKNFSKYSNLTFYIYLMHAGIWDLIFRMFSALKGNDYLTSLNGAVWIPVFVFIVFMVSYYLSKIYIWIWNKLDRKKRITKLMSKAVHL